MPLRAIARLIQTMLYAQRFFPYYVYNILGGIGEDGKCSFLLRATDLRPRTSVCSRNTLRTSNVYCHRLLLLAYQCPNGEHALGRVISVYGRGRAYHERLLRSRQKMSSCMS